MAMIATLAALVLGLMTASASDSLESKETELRSTAARVLLLDPYLGEIWVRDPGSSSTA
jgi:hypothetical protein